MPLHEIPDEDWRRIARTVRRSEREPEDHTQELGPQFQPPRICVVVMQVTVGPGKAGTARVYRITNSADVASGDDVTIAAVDPTKDIVVLNFRPNWLAGGVAYLAHRVGTHWVVENDACFQDFMA